MEKIGMIFDWINKFISRAKGLGYIAAVVMVLLFFVNHGCNQAHIERLIEKTTGLNVKNDLLLQQNDQLEETLTDKDSLLKAKNLKIDSITESLNSRIKQVWYWRGEYDKIAERVDTIPIDVSYQFTQKVYDFPGIKKYPYNGSQVRGIHKTWLENRNKTKQLGLLESSLYDCQNKITLMEDVEETIQEKFMIKSTQFSNSKEIIENKDTEIKLLRKQLRRESQWFAGWGIGPELGVGYDFVNSKSTVFVGVGIHYNLYKW